MAALVLAGAVLRAVAMVAYRPALLFPDSFRYMAEAHSFYLSKARPGGYGLLLWPVARVTESPTVYALINHLIGLALSVLCYAFLVRRGLPRWGAALAMVPLLFDPLQLVLEEYVLSDVLFSAVVVVACVIVLWRPQPTTRMAAGAGVLLGYAGLVRGVGSFLLVAFVIALLCLRVSWVKVVAFVVAVIVPLALYASAYLIGYGQFALVSSGPRFLYARVAPFLPCDRAELASYERELCPAEPVGKRPDTDYFMWGGGHGPAYHVHPPKGMTAEAVIKDFDKRMIRAHPLTYARVVLTDAAGGFTPSRTHDVPGYPASYWLFRDYNWSLDAFPSWKHRYAHDSGPGSQASAAAAFLTGYRKVLHTPGPMMAVLLALAVAASFGVGRSRFSGVRVAVGLLAGCCAVTLLTAAGFSGFSWRYQLPQIPLLPMAGSLAIAALARGPALGTELSWQPPLLDRWAGPISAWARRTWPGGSWVERDDGRLQLVLAAVAGVTSGVMCGLLAMVSGWSATLTAVALGVGVATATTTTLIVCRRRALAALMAT